MSDLTDRLDAIRARVDAATPGPWRWDENYGDANDTGLALTNDAGAEIIGAYNHHCCSYRDDPTVKDNDAELIAAAPSDVAFLLDLARKQQAALDAVREWCDTNQHPFHPSEGAEGFSSQDWALDDAARRVRTAVTAAMEAKP